MAVKSVHLEEDIRTAADIIRKSSKTVILTGAGVSTPSGIPDFRSIEGGLWTKYDPFEVASLSAFRNNPEKFYRWIRPLASKIMDAEPNDAHVGIAQMEDAGFIQTIVTQNIDGLHQRAGTQKVLELHGSWDYLSCTVCFQQFESRSFMKPFLNEGEVPYCLQCGCVLKPDLILMGEQLPARVWLEANRASKSCDLMIVAGSSLEIYPAAGLPTRALDNGAKLIIINQSETYIDVRADLVIQEDASYVIPLIAEKVMAD